MQRPANELMVVLLERAPVGAIFHIQKNHLKGLHRHMIHGFMRALLETN
jgi:hypothetical protein